MCWTVLPLMCYYLDNGHFSIKNKLLHAIRYNLCFYGVAGVIGVVILASLVVTKLQVLR